MDIKDFFSPHQWAQQNTCVYQSISATRDLFAKYKLHDKIHNGYIYCRIKKGMYGLKQAAVLAFNSLKETFAPFGYETIAHTDGVETQNKE